MQQFLKYAFIGIINTLIHWAIFFSLLEFLSLPQMYSNGFAFLGTVSISFILNAKFTFKKELSIVRYLMFTTFMFLLALFVGYLADITMLSPLCTQVIFSLVSLILGFLYSKLIVFR